MFKYVYVVYVISFIVENFYLYVYMYIVYYVWYIFRDECRCSKIGICMYCICVLVIKLNMYIMNVVDKKFY